MRGYWLAASAMYETLAISLPTVIDALFHKMTMERADRRLSSWSNKLLRHAAVDLSIEGHEHIEPKRPYILMSNHQSHYDIPALFQAFPGTLRMVTKIELFRVPIWGAAMREAGFIAIDRQNREAAIKSLETAKVSLDRGVSVWIAPEGTRSTSGVLGPFKKGGFVLAQDTGLAILPVGIAGTRAILPKKAAQVRMGARVRVRFGKPIAPEADRDDLIQKVREAIMLLRGDEDADG